MGVCLHWCWGFSRTAILYTASTGFSLLPPSTNPIYYNKLTAMAAPAFNDTIPSVYLDPEEIEHMFGKCNGYYAYV